MQLGTSFREIVKISIPIMAGSAVQQIIALSDSVFLYHLSELDFAAIGIVSVFYLIVSAIGFGFSKGGQIMIARRVGENKAQEVGRTFYAMFYFELFLAVLLFLGMYFGSGYLFEQFVSSEMIVQKSLEYLNYRQWGVFFSFSGLAFVALYTGIARTSFILIDALILAVVNIVLNYSLIFGHFGMPAMGIEGAGLASTIAEAVAFFVFVVYVLWDKHARHYQLFKLPKIDWQLIQTQFKLSTPVVAQAVVGFGSWFVFFSIVENLGERPLAITNLARMVYLSLSIPTWGFASGANTMVSNFIGQNKHRLVIPLLWKISKICLTATMLLALPIVLFPEQLLYPLLGSEDMSLINDAQPVLYIVAIILGLFAIGGVFFNGLAGTGATYFGLKIQTLCAVLYLAYIYIAVNYTNGGLEGAWTAEVFYWILIFGLTYWYLKGKRWYQLEV